MSSGIIDIADAITTVLNTAIANDEFDAVNRIFLNRTGQFTATRVYKDWADDFEDIDDLSIDVIPVTSPNDGAEVVELLSFQSLKAEPEIDVAIRRRFKNADRVRSGARTGRIRTDRIDELVLLTEQIYQKLVGLRREDSIEIGDGRTAKWSRCEIRTLCDYWQLRQGNYLGVVRLTYMLAQCGS